MIMSKRLTAEEFIERAKKIHEDRYDYSKVEYKNSLTKVTIICPEHGEFEQTPHDHLRSHSCPYCSGKLKSNTEEFIRRAREIHGDKYDYSEVDYKNANTKLTIICPELGEFEQRASSHLSGCGCPKCAGKNITTEEFIRRAREIHGDKYDYSKVEYKDAITKVTIICPIHGEFQQRPDHHLNGHSCPYCNGSKLTKEEFIRKAREIHSDKYDYSKVEYKNAITKVTIICPEHGEFEQTPNSHLRGYGCSRCSRLTTEDFIRRAGEIHGDKYDYSKVDYKDSQTKITIICPKHGEFQQRPSNHLRGKGCPYCADNLKLTKEEFIKKAKEIHKDKYDYSKVEYKNTRTKVTIICPIHGEFKQRAGNHLKGQGCPVCCVNKPKLDNTQSSHRVYIFDFPDKIRYVGLTMKSIEVRESEHRNGRVHSNGTYSSSVYKYSIELNVPIPKPFIFKDNLTPEEAQYWEGWIIEDSKQNGYTLLNVAKAGGLGGYTY